MSFDFTDQTVTFGFNRQQDYDSQAVIAALADTGKFKGATELWRK